MKLLSRFFVCALLVLSTNTTGYADPATGIIVYYSPQNRFQALLAAAINKHLTNTFSLISVEFITDNNLTVINENDLLISIGNQEEIDGHLATLKNNIIYINDAEQDNTDVRLNTSYTNIEIEQPPCRYLNLIRGISRQWRNIGYLKSAKNDRRLAALQQCSKSMDLSINDIMVDNNSDLPGSIEKMLKDSDVLLALPDDRIYNRHSVKNILLSTYRQRIPVIGFSKSFVSAGALAAAYSTPDQIAQQLITILTYRLKPDMTPVGNNIYPENSSVSTNRQVAKSLNLQIPGDDSIKFSMQLLEGKK